MKLGAGVEERVIGFVRRLGLNCDVSESGVVLCSVRIP